MSLMNRLLILASLLGVATFFVPFAYGTSGISAIHDAAVWRLAVPFLVPFVAVIARTIQLNRGELGAGTRMVVYGWAIVTLLVTLSLYIPSGSNAMPNGVGEWIAYVLPFVVGVACGTAFLRSRKKPAIASMRPLLALRVAYLPNAVMCLYSFLHEGANVGTYMALFTTAIYAVDVIQSGR